MFSGLSSLEQLYLDGNALTSLPEGVFSGLSSLTFLRLSDNPGTPFQVELSLESDSVASTISISDTSGCTRGSSHSAQYQRWNCCGKYQRNSHHSNRGNHKPFCNCGCCGCRGSRHCQFWYPACFDTLSHMTMRPILNPESLA